MIPFFRAGFKLTVIDSSDKDWWKGKCLGSVGVFPSNYVTKINPGERPLQVTQTVQINSLSIQEPPIKLLRDQVSRSSLWTTLGLLPYQHSVWVGHSKKKSFFLFSYFFLDCHSNRRGQWISDNSH